jgi:hypothetical protein
MGFLSRKRRDMKEALEDLNLEVEDEKRSGPLTEQKFCRPQFLMGSTALHRLRECERQ